MLGYNLTTKGKHALVIKQRPIVKTPSDWDEHDLLWSIQIQGVFHRRHCLKVPLPQHRGVHSSDTSCSCDHNCYIGCTVLPPCRPQTRSYHSGYDVMARAFLLSLCIWNVPWFGTILSD